MAVKVLVVDDETAICNLLKMFLTEKGYEVSIASEGLEAIDKLKAEKPRIVLLDIKIPGISGVETLKKMREIDPAVGVIMITGIRSDIVGKECLELGAYDYITKPFSLEYLQDVLMVKLLDFDKE